MNISGLAELCIGSCCLGSLMILAFIVADIGENKAREHAAERQFKKKFKARNK